MLKQRKIRASKPPAHPTPKELVAFRARHGLSQSEAAAFAYSSLRSWQNWEAGTWQMHPAIWQWVLHSVAASLYQTVV